MEVNPISFFDYDGFYDGMALWWYGAVVVWRCGGMAPPFFVILAFGELGVVEFGVEAIGFKELGVGALLYYGAVFHY